MRRACPPLAPPARSSGQLEKITAKLDLTDGQAARDSWHPPPPFFHKVLILNGVKVVCFDTLLQVLILNNLQWTVNCEIRAIQRHSGEWRSQGLKQKRQQDAGAMRAADAILPKAYDTLGVTVCQGKCGSKFMTSGPHLS